MAQRPRALITGITGQDGSYLAEFLLEQGYAVIVFLAVVLLLTYRILKNLGLIGAPPPAVPGDAERETS